MNSYLEFMKFLFWLFARAIILKIRGLVWKLSGVSKQLEDIGCPDSEHSVHVQNIVARYNIDPIDYALSEKNFITAHERFECLDYVLRDNVTLMTVTDTEALFVETEPNLDVADSDNGAFMKVAQFWHAKKLIFMPLGCFLKLSETLPDLGSRLLILGTTGRCGGTLMAQVFESTGRCVAWSEPEPMNTVLGIPDTERGDAIVKSLVKMLCKPVSKPVELYVLKIIVTTSAMPRFHKLFPNAKKLYMYRDPVGTIKSMTRWSYSTPVIDLTMRIGYYSAYMAGMCMELLGMAAEELKKETRYESRTKFNATFNAMLLSQYADFKHNGIPIVAIKYEDILERTMESCQKIFEYVGLEFDEGAKQAVTTAFGRDSQRGTPISREALSKYTGEEIDEEKKRVIDDVFAKFGLPPVADNGYVAPDTMTTATL